MHSIFLESPNLDFSWADDIDSIQVLDQEWQPDFSRPVIIDSAQTWRAEHQHRIETWHRQYFSRQVFVNYDWVPDLQQFLIYHDRDDVHAVITGALHWEPQHMRVWRYENFFHTMQQLYTKIPQARRTQLLDPGPRPYNFDAMLGAVDGKHSRVWLLDKCEPRTDIITRYYRGGHNLDTFPDQFEPPEGLEPADHLARPWSADGAQHFYANREYLFHGQSATISHIIPWNIYDRSAFSIISETSASNGYCFYTEKTVKPIMTGRLFVMFAGQYYLRYLRELGFRTFDGIIDERYDMEPDDERRWGMAWQQVLMLGAMDQTEVMASCRARVQHNQDWFWTQDWGGIYQRAMINAVTT